MSTFVNLLEIVHDAVNFRASRRSSYDFWP
jgi:hypothetical protein